jgi:hypothetical protein
MVARELGSYATLQDWVDMSKVCRMLHNDCSVMFLAWLDSQSIGHGFACSPGTKAELAFLRRHIHGMC